MFTCVRSQNVLLNADLHFGASFVSHVQILISSLNIFQCVLSFSFDVLWRIFIGLDLGRGTTEETQMKKKQSYEPWVIGMISN